MWTDSERLGEALRCQFEQFADQYSIRPSALAVTMTGELADCFPTRRVGVERILSQIALAYPPSDTHVYAVDGSWLTPAEAKRAPWQVAASNWHALANWAHRSPIATAASSSPPPALQAVIDVGSTTVDIIPLDSRGVATSAQTDRERLQLGQLVYTGMQRTPVAAMLQSVRLHDVNCPLMAERFATSDDAYVSLGWVPEVPDDCDTADGRPRTIDCARARLARMIGEDTETLPIEDIESIARQIVDAQVVQVGDAMARNIDLRQFTAVARSNSPSIPSAQKAQPALLISGHGRPLIDRVAQRLGIDRGRMLWLDEMISPAAARVGPALAVAWLYEHQRAVAQPTS
jgi:probable H4MPT-linked C1 transfer pathway protein